ncbi:MAG TPA: tetratricopeptide repeat protein [Terriglobia bacterium]|nr:tetratricopeptide repeat protein [Terriglobia bacterium]
MGHHRQQIRGGVISALALILLLDMFPPSAVAEEGKAKVAGQVTTSNGKTIPFGVNVQLQAPGGQIAGQQPADSSGRFQFDYVEKKDYTLLVTAEGYQPVTQDLDLRYGDRLFVTIRLTPVGHKLIEDRGTFTSVEDLKVPDHAKRQYVKGDGALKAQNFSAARRFFEQAVQEYPCYAQAQLGLATVLIATKQSSHAEDALRKAIQCAPAFLDAYVELSQLFNAEKRYDESSELLQPAIERSPDTWQLRYQIGVAHYGLKQYEEAEKDFLGARSLNQTPPPILHIKLADVYLKKSEFGKAYAEMQSYLTEQPDGRFASRIKTVIQQMKADGLVPTDPAASTAPRNVKP